MTQRGRKSLASLSIARAPAIPGRPEPLDGLSEAEVEWWKAIVAEKPANWFDAGSIPLLAAYCRGVVSAEEMALELAKMGDGWLAEGNIQRAKIIKDMLLKQESLNVSIATKLRLTQQSRYTPKAADTAARNSAKPKLWEAG